MGSASFPVWAEARHPYATHELPRTAEIVVAGGGLVGVLTALTLAETGRRVVVVERDRLGGAASGRNGGLLIPGGAEPYHALVGRWGRADARSIYAAFHAGALAIAERMAHDIDCQWRPDGCFHAASSDAETDDLQATARYLAEDGLEGTWLPSSELGAWLSPLRQGLAKDTIHGALYVREGGAFHSGLLVSGLAAAAERVGVRVTEGIEVTGLEESPQGARVSTRRGPISCDAVVVAVNAWTGGLLPDLGRLIEPVRGQVLASRPLPDGAIKGAWSLNRGFEYAQQLPSGRVVLGGFRWAVPGEEVGYAQPDLNPVIQERLTEMLATWFPGAATPLVETRWAGIMDFTADRLPLIGPVPEAERQWVAAGFNGHGIPSAPVATDLIRAQINGDSLPEHARFFRPDRPLAPPTEAA